MKPLRTILGPLFLVVVLATGARAQTPQDAWHDVPGDTWYHVPGYQLWIYEYDGAVQWRVDDGRLEIRTHTAGTVFDVDDDTGTPVAVNLNEGDGSLHYDGNGVSITVGNDGDGTSITLNGDGNSVNIEANDTSSTLEGQSDNNAGVEGANTTGNTHANDGTGSGNTWTKGGNTGSW